VAGDHGQEKEAAEIPLSGQLVEKESVMRDFLRFAIKVLYLDGFYFSLAAVVVIGWLIKLLIFGGSLHFTIP
jgi:hypothetical protein